MGKLVVLKIGEGSFESGFPVTLQIGEEEARPSVEVDGKLPAAPELPLYYSRWQSSYCMLGFCTRLSAQVIQTDSESLIADCNTKAQILRARFNAWLQLEEFRKIQDHWREELSPSEEIRVILQTENNDLQRLPWHLWELLERYPKAEIALSAPVYRQVIRPFSVKKRVKILAILGNSEGIDVEADRALLEKLPDASVQFLVEPRRKELTDELWGQSWDVLFFAGHSEGKTRRMFINQNDCLTIDELKYALRKAVNGGLKLAIFNSCEGLGLARDLADLQIPQTILMREPIPDYVAQEFLKYFLTAFSQGESLYLAVRTARERLQAMEDEFPCATWLPFIFQHPAEVPLGWKALKGPVPPRTPLPPPPSSPGLIKLLLASLVVTASLIGVRHLGLLQAWELKAFDQMLQVRSTVLRPGDLDNRTDSRILVVKITDQDLDAERKRGAEDTSLTNTSLVRLLQVLQKYRPRAIGLDLYRDSKGVPANVTQILNQTPNLIGICKSQSTKFDPNGVPPPAGIPNERIGFSDAPEDPDGVSRRQLLRITQEAGSLCPTSYSLSVKLALRYLEAKGIHPKLTSKGYLQLGNTVLKPLSAASGGYQRVSDLNVGTQILLNYRPLNVPSVTLSEVLKNDKPLAIRDGIVLIGATHGKTDDKWITPYSQGSSNPTIPGVFIQAQKVSQILSTVLDGRPILWVWDGWVEVIWIASWSLVGGLVVWQLRSPLFQILGIVTVSTLLGAVCFGILTKGGWVPLVPPGLALMLVGGTAAIYRVHIQQKQASH